MSETKIAVITGLKCGHCGMDNSVPEFHPFWVLKCVYCEKLSELPNPFEVETQAEP